MPQEYSDRELEEMLRRVHEWGKEWSESASFAALPSEQQEQAEFVVGTFAEYMYSYHLQLPEEWEEAGLVECCLETLPRKISADEDYYRAIAPVLGSFLTFLEQTGRLEKGRRLAEKTAAIADRIVSNAADPRYWGMAKSFMMGAKAAGVDVADRGQLQQYILAYNQAQALSRPALHQPPPALTPKVGRNEPCPCGSGAKYKRCCGR
jgi:hypothetical protein